MLVMIQPSEKMKSPKEKVQNWGVKGGGEGGVRCIRQSTRALFSIKPPGKEKISTGKRAGTATEVEGIRKMGWPKRQSLRRMV